MYSYFAYYGPCILSIYLFSPTGLERQFTFYKSLIPSQSGCLFYSRNLVIYSTLKTNKVLTHVWARWIHTKNLDIFFLHTPSHPHTVIIGAPLEQWSCNSLYSCKIKKCECEFGCEDIFFLHTPPHPHTVFRGPTRAWSWDPLIMSQVL